MMWAAYRQFLADDHWQTAMDGLPDTVAAWLGYRASLTQKLQQHCDQLQVAVLSQGWQAVSSEQRFANFSSNQTACWLREVVLKGDGAPWIFAQTVLPEETINAVAQDVLKLGEQPIGLWLFPQQPTRISLEWRQDPQTGLYARRSQLALQGYPLWIAECFLPQFPFEATPRKG